MPKSIRGRMLLLSAVATLAALVVAAFVMVHVLERIVTQGIDRRLDAQIALLATSVDADGRLDRKRLAAVDEALFAGPGWEWRIGTPSEMVSSGGFGVLDDRGGGTAQGRIPFHPGRSLRKDTTGAVSGRMRARQS